MKIKMKIYLLPTLFAIFFCMQSVSFANTILIEKNLASKSPFIFQGTLGYQYDTNNSQSTTTNQSIKVSYTNFQHSTFTIHPFIKFAMSKVESTTKDPFGTKSYVESNNYGRLTIGADFIIKEWRDLTFFGSLSYTHQNIEIDTYTKGGVDFLDGHEFKASTLALELGLSRMIILDNAKTLKPYAGIRINYNRKESITSTTSSTETDMEFPLFAGILYEVGPSLSLGLETTYLNSNNSIILSAAFQY